MLTYVSIDRIGPSAEKRFGKISSMAFFSYHGIGQRGGIDLSFAAPHYLDENNTAPIHIMRSGTVWPDLFNPAQLTTIVSFRLTEILSQLPNLRFDITHLDKAVDMNVAINDFELESWYRTVVVASGTYHPFDLFADSRELHKHAPPYYELIAGRYERILDGTSGRMFTYNSWSPDGLVPRSIMITDHLFERFPVFARECLFVRSDVYDRVQTYIPTKYYRVEDLQCTDPF